MKTTIYLCGGINALSDTDATDWREAAKKAFADKQDVFFLDPMRNDYRGKENQPGIDAQIVRDDRSDIEESDIILVNALRPSWGTAMEVFLSWTKGKYIVTVCPSDKPSPWLTYHSDKVVKTFEEAFKDIRASKSVT